MADRAPVWTEGSEWCDNMESKRTSPDWQGQGWYRVTGEAGTIKTEFSFIFCPVNSKAEHNSTHKY